MICQCLGETRAQYWCLCISLELPNTFGTPAVGPLNYPHFITDPLWECSTRVTIITMWCDIGHHVVWHWLRQHIGTDAWRHWTVASWTGSDSHGLVSYEQGFWYPKTLTQVLAFLLTSLCPHLTVSWFPHLTDADNHNTYLMELLWRLFEKFHGKCPEQGYRKHPKFSVCMWINKS